MPVIIDVTGFLVVSQFENYSLLLVMMSEAPNDPAGERGRVPGPPGRAGFAGSGVGVEPSRECVLHYAATESSTETLVILAEGKQLRNKMRERERLEAAWQRTHSRDASTARSSRKLALRSA